MQFELHRFDRHRKENAMTKSTRVVLALFVALTATAALAQSAPRNLSTSSNPSAAPGKGRPAAERYRSHFPRNLRRLAVMSEIHGHGPEDMISMFHLDGPNRLLITHYCSAGNQPRMQASSSPDGKTITFTFVDATILQASTPDTCNSW